LKRLRLLCVRDALDASAWAVRVGESSTQALAKLAALDTERIVLLDAADKPLGSLGVAQLRAIDGTLAAAHASLAAPPATVNCRDDLRTVVSQMFASGSTRLPAIDEDGRFAGYVSQERIVELLRVNEAATVTAGVKEAA
jgi:osmoprotectant transport system ATP-binding protein